MRTLLAGGRLGPDGPDAPDADVPPHRWSRGSILIDDGRVVWRGSDEAGRDFSTDRVVELDGAVVVPGFVDSHFHATDTGLAVTGLALGPAATLASALDQVELAARRARGRPLLGSGWDETRWPERRPPSRTELDRASYGGVVYLARTDGHSAVVSSALLASVPGIDRLAGYSADGWLTAEAHHAARRVAMAVITAGQRETVHRTALMAAAARGVVAVHEMSGPEVASADDLAALLALAGDRSQASDESLPEVRGYWGELHGIELARELGAVGAGGDLFCDGSLGSHTAALSEPYADSPGQGELRYTTAELVEHIVACTRAGLQAGFHAIGDAAVGQVVGAMQLASVRFPAGQWAAAGHRIEHAELVPSVLELAATGVTASVQPAFDATWGGPSGMYSARLGRERSAGMNPFSALLTAGVRLAFGSDSPVTPIDPWAALLAAVRPTNAAHALTWGQALSAHTVSGWRAGGSTEPLRGRLAAGAPADYAIFAPDGDAFENADGRSVNLRCLRTVSGEVVLYDSGELAPAPEGDR